MNKNIIKRNFSKAATFYDKYAKIQKTAALDLVQKSAIINQGPINSILELGSGTGLYTELLIDAFPKSQILAIDISKQMTAFASAKINNPMVEFITADITNFEPISTFDLISANAVLHWINHIDDFFNKQKKSLNPLGAFSFSYFGRETCSELNYILNLFNKTDNLTSNYFLTSNELFKMVKSHFYNIYFEEKREKEEFKSVLDLLKASKFTGTRGIGLDSKIWTKDFINKLETQFLKEFGKIEVTYQIFYVIGTRVK